MQQIHHDFKLLDSPVIEVSITFDGVNEDSFDSLKSDLTKAVANTLSVKETVVTLKLQSKMKYRL